jgi:hypothetical protein
MRGNGSELWIEILLYVSVAFAFIISIAATLIMLHAC